MNNSHILTVTLNPAIDKSTTTGLIQPEAKQRCTQVLNEPGGGGINVSKALKKLRSSSVALFTAGGYNGEMLKSLLTKEGIRFHSTDSTVETRENWVVLETETNNQFRFTFPGRAVEQQVIKDLIQSILSFSPEYVVTSGSLPAGLPDHFYGMVVKTANSVGAKCIVDTSGAALQALKGKHAFLIKPNISELCKMLGIEHLSEKEVPDAAQQAVRDGFAELVAVSMGPDGAWLVTKEKKYFAAAPAVIKKSTVGAGDSMVAGITFMLQQKHPLQQVINFGVACGSAATMNHGTQLFNLEDVHALYEQINKKKSRHSLQTKGCIMILGAPNDFKGNLSLIATTRLRQGAKELLNNPDFKILLTGGFGKHFNDTDQPHWKYAKEYLINQLSVSPGSFLPDTIESANTVEDIKKAVPVIQKYNFQTMILITSEFHLKRVKLITERQPTFKEINVSYSYPPDTELPKNLLTELKKHEKRAIDYLN